MGRRCTLSLATRRERSTEQWRSKSCRGAQRFPRNSAECWQQHLSMWAGAGSTKRRTTKFLPGASIPPAIQELIKEATDSQAKLAKEASVIIKAWTGDKMDERFKKLKSGHGTCQTNIAKLNHMREFHELPDNLESTKENLDQVMLAMATHTSEYNELVEVTRGLIKASKK